MTDTYKCPTCSGCGRIELNGVYAETLETMRRRCGKNDFIVANMHADCFHCKPTALNNRLRRLEELGFLRSERYGKQRRFYLKGK